MARSVRMNELEEKRDAYWLVIERVPMVPPTAQFASRSGRVLVCRLHLSSVPSCATDCRLLKPAPGGQDVEL